MGEGLRTLKSSRRGKTVGGEEWRGNQGGGLASLQGAENEDRVSRQEWTERLAPLPRKVWGLDGEAHSARVPGQVAQGLQRQKDQSGHKQGQQHKWRQSAPQPVKDGVDGTAPQSRQVCKEPGSEGHETVGGPVMPHPSLGAGGKASLTLVSIFPIFYLTSKPLPPLKPHPL